MGHSEATALLRRPRLTVAQYHRMGAAGVAEAWIIDLDQNLVHLLRQPVPGSDGALARYTEVQVTARPGVARPLALPAVAVDLAPLLAAP